MVFELTAVVEKRAAPKTVDYFATRAGRADMAAFDRFMSRANGTAPRPEDRWDQVQPRTEAGQGGITETGRR